MIQALAEYESSNLEVLHRTCLKFRENYQFRDVLGNCENPIYSMWEQLGKHGARIRITQPSDLHNFNLNKVAQLGRKHTSQTRKTLHFGPGSALPGHLNTLTAEAVEGADIEHIPPVAALGWVLSEMEVRKAVKVNSKRYVNRNHGPHGWMAH